MENKLSDYEIISQVKSIILKHTKPIRIYLYGSKANGESNRESDIDIAYEDKDFKDNYLIEEELKQIKTLKKLDVKNLSICDERFKNRVYSTGKVLFSANKKLRVEDSLYNYKNALEKFISVIDRKNEFEEQGFGDIYLDIIVKRFEFTYEMAWKTLKRYLSFLGIEVKSPRQSFQEGYSAGIIKEEEVWLDMIEQRNMSSHIYSFDEISYILEKLSSYKKGFLDLKNTIETEISTN